MKKVQINAQAFQGFIDWLDKGGQIAGMGLTVSPHARDLILNTLQGPMSGFSVVDDEGSDPAPTPEANPVPEAKPRKPRKPKNEQPTIPGTQDPA